MKLFALLLGGSDRPQHRIMNCIAAGLISAIDIAITASPEGIITGLSCLAMENYATPDRDVEHKRGNWLMHWYWLLYEGAIPYHRHPLSHSLLLGLPLRLLWALWPAALLYVARGGDWQQVWEMAQGPMLWRVAVGCIVSDIAHYALDDFSPVEMVVGKNNTTG